LATGAVEDEVTVALDDKRLRRSDLLALQVVTAAAQGLGMVLGQELAERQDEVAARL